MKMPRIINIIFLQGLLDQLKFMVMLALTRLGMLNLPEQAESEDPASGLVLVIMDGLSPSLIPVQSLMVLIKKRVPVIEYSNFLERYGVMHDEDVDMECSVCLNCVERSHEIRELCNCYHVFHKECLDRWVDEGQVT
uniref:RING-type domain-containing protein n=1 Tax=Quercus lobata TaxID=97700 RepID=A0A7N2KUM1_QUELO